MYVEIEIITDEYRSRAALALHNGQCPDCNGRMCLAPDNYADPTPGTNHEHLACKRCDTEWRYMSNPDAPEGYPVGDWKRTQAGASAIHNATHRHPHLQTFARALTTGEALDPVDAPVFVSVPMNRFPATEAENEQIAANGLFIYYPPHMLGHARHDAVAAGQAAAQRAAADATTGDDDGT